MKLPHLSKQDVHHFQLRILFDFLHLHSASRIRVDILDVGHFGIVVNLYLTQNLLNIKYDVSVRLTFATWTVFALMGNIQVKKSTDVRTHTHTHTQYTEYRYNKIII